MTEWTLAQHPRVAKHPLVPIRIGEAPVLTAQRAVRAREMIHVKITGCNVGFRKVECTKTLQTAAGLGLTEAKQMTAAVLGGETSVIEMKSESEAKALVTQLEQLGAVANVDGAL